MPRVRRMLALFLPGGLAGLAALAWLRPGLAPDSVSPYIHAFAIMALVVGIFLGWSYNRSRVVFALLLLGIADVTLRWLGKGDTLSGDLGRALVGALAVLLPLNLAAYSVLTERGSLRARSLRRLIPILGQIVAVGLIARLGWSGLPAWLDQRWLEEGWTGWTALPQAGVAAFAGTTLFLVLRCVRRRDPIDAGFMWALASAFLALHGVSRGWAPTAFFATGGLVLIGSLTQAGARPWVPDELTELPGRPVLKEALPQLGGGYLLALVRVDHFTRLKRTFGRAVGDQVLRMVATQLRRVPGGMAFRYGRDTFAVLFEGVSPEGAVPQLEVVRRVIASYCFVVRGPGRPRNTPAVPTPPTGPRVVVPVTVSVGAAERQGRRARPRHVIRAAREALRHATETGPNQVIA